MRLEITRRADLVVQAMVAPRHRDATVTTALVVSSRERPAWRAVALPSEHGGWALTLEPAVLGLLVAPSKAGAALGLAALVAFVARTPLKVVLVDRWRHRWLPRSRTAARIASVELLLLGVLVIAAGRWTGWSWLVPVGLALPLVAIELWFDMHSRGRRLLPELCGAVGISSVVAVVAVAGGDSARLAAGLWLVVAARAVASIPFVRVQISRLRHGAGSTTTSDAAQLVGVAIAGTAVLVEHRLAVGLGAVAVLALAQVVWVRRPPLAAKLLGLRQMALGLALVALTAAGVLVT